MTPVGGGKPLFDLVANGRRGDDSDSTSQSPGHGADRDDGRREIGARTVTLPMVWVYAGIGLLLLILFAGYGIGFQLGTASTREAERQAAAKDAERIFVDDPLQLQPSLRDATGQTRQPQGEENDQGTLVDRESAALAAEGSATPPSDSVLVLQANGRLGPDPRRIGVNYLELVALPRDRAIEAVRYLSGRGQEAIAVPLAGLDPSGRGSNTNDSFRVIALGLAVPGDRFRSSTDARRRFEERLAVLGKAWAAEGGASDFSDPLWRRYGG